MAVMKHMNDGLDQLFDYSLPKFFSPEEKSTFIDLIEKCKVALKYLNKNNHENFWDFFQVIITKEIDFRKIILDLNRKAEELAFIKERVSDTIIWKFGLYNHCRIILLQELSNFITNGYEKARVYKTTSPYIAKDIINRANELSAYYLKKFSTLHDLQIAEDDNIVEHCIYVVEDSIEIGKNSLKAISFS